MDVFTTYWTRATARWARVPDEQRPTVVAILMMSAIGLVLIGGFALHTPMVALDPQPSGAEDRLELLAELRARNFPFEVHASTGAILVPAAQREEIQIEVGTLIQPNKPVGLEIFDETEFGGTQFREHTRYLRGLQGEIEKMLNAYRGVTGSKVLLSMQRDALFKEDRIEPHASVLLELKPGVELTAAEGERMARQVAGAVVGLAPERVQILDAQMRSLHGAVDGDDEGTNSGLAALQREWERYYQRKVESLMFEMLGYGNASVTVSVDIDHAQRSVYERDLDPDRIVTIASKATEQATEGSASASGVAGTGSNLGGPPAGESGAMTSRSSEALNIDVPETKKTDVTAPGRILNISAGVAVAWKAAPDAAGAAVEGEGAETSPATATGYTKWTEEELTDLTTLVRNALGPHATKVDVFNHQFPVLELSPSTASMFAQLNSDTASSVARYSLALFAFLFLYGMVLRPLVRNLAAPEAGSDSELAELATADGAPELPAPEFSQPEFDVQGWLDRFSTGDQFVSRSDVSRLVLADVAHSVVTLQEWLTEEEDA